MAEIKSLRAGRSDAESILFFNYPKSTEYDIVRRCSGAERSEEASTTALKKVHDRPRSVRTPKFVAGTQKLISGNPGTLLRKPHGSMY